MSVLSSYKNLVDIIKIHENLLKVYQNNLKLVCAFQIKLGAPAGYRESTSYLDADCIHGGKPEAHEKEWNKLTEEVTLLNDKIEFEKDVLTGYYQAKKNIDEKLEGLDGLEYKIAYLKYAEGYDLQQIASKLGYNYDYIRRISAKCHKKVTKKSQTSYNDSNKMVVSNII